MATLCSFTANSIIKSIKDNVQSLEKNKVLLASGSGVRNQTLMKMIEELLLNHIRITLSDEYGISAQFKEVIKFATLAYATVNQLPNNIPSASGARQHTILVKISLTLRLAQRGSK